MAIDFPNSPSLNDEFTVGDRVWFWNGTVWKAKETAILETGKYIVSDTAPVNPEEGDAWFDSARTKEFIYYDGFWVETSAAAIGLPADDYATETYVTNAVAGIVDSAPSTLDTLNELAAALADDPSFATTITNSLANKSDVGHTHPISDVVNLQTSLDNKKKEVNQTLSTNATLVAGYRYFVDTSAARTLTLPATPAVGDEIQLFDATGTGSTNNVTINNNSEKINGVLDSAIIDIDGFATVFVYTGSTYGWRMI